MARLALAASVLLSLFLLSVAHRLHPDLPTEDDALSASIVESHPDLRTEDDAVSASTEESHPAAIRLPSDKPSDESATVQVATTPFPTIEIIQVEPIEASLIPIRRDFPHPRVVGRSFWRRLGRHCHHLHRGPHGGIHRGALIPYGDDMIVPAEQVHGGYKDGRLLSREAFPDGHHHHPVMMEAIPVEELAKQRDMGLPREMRPFPRFRPQADGHEGEDGLVKRFLDFLNRH